MKKSKIFTLFVSLLTALTCYAQTSLAASWGRFFDSPGNWFDDASAVIADADGTYFVAGIYNGGGGDNFLVQRLDENGNPLWQREYDAGGDDHIYQGIKTSDGGYILVGYIALADNDVLVVKLDYNGNATWSKRYGAVGSAENGFAIHETSDGGFIICGNTDVLHGVPGDWDSYILKISSNGTLQWDSTYGGDPLIVSDDSLDFLTDIIENNDGTYTAVGSTYSFGGGVDNEEDGLVLNILSDGTINPADPLYKPSRIYQNIVTPSVPFISSTYFNTITSSISAGGLTVSGRVHQANGNNIDEGLVISFDASGSIRYSNVYGDGTPEEDFYEDHKMNGRNIVLVGETDYFSTTSIDGLITTVDDMTGLLVPGLLGNAVIHADNSYMVNPPPAFSPTPNRFATFDFANDGGLILGGRANFPTPGKKNPDAWVLKTNTSYGVDDVSCSNARNVTLIQAPITYAINNATVITVPSIATENNILLATNIPTVTVNSFCASCFYVYGSDPMDAGTTNELTVEAYDTWWNYADNYTGVYNLIFSGLGSMGTYIPEVEGFDFGISTPVSFTNGISDLNAATLTAYKAETARVEVSDGLVSSTDPACVGGLPLTVNGVALNHYEVSATTPQTRNVGWAETVRAVDLYGNLRTGDNHSFNVTNSGVAEFYTDGTYSVNSATYNLVSGLAQIFLKDRDIETINITATDAALITGTSGPIDIRSGSAGGSGGGGSGGGSTSYAAPEEESYAAPEDYLSLSCLEKQTPDYSFTDITGHFAETAIQLLAETLSSSNYVTIGYPEADGSFTFRPNQPITRAEFLKMAMLSNCVTKETFDSTNIPAKIFTDIQLNSGAWYKDFVYSASKAGIVAGYPDGNFNPNQPITRAEATKILVNIQHLMASGYVPTDYFTDVDVNDWYYNYVSSGKENELIFGSEDSAGNSVFKPNDNISRAETALLLVRIFNLREYVIFTDPNADDYQYVVKAEDMQASLLSINAGAALLPFILILGPGGAGFVLYMNRQRKKKK